MLQQLNHSQNLVVTVAILVVVVLIVNFRHAIVKVSSFLADSATAFAKEYNDVYTGEHSMPVSGSVISSILFFLISSEQYCKNKKTDGNSISGDPAADAKTTSSKSD